MMPEQNLQRKKQLVQDLKYREKKICPPCLPVRSGNGSAAPNVRYLRFSRA